MFQTTNQSILWGTGKKMLGNEELHFTPGKPRFPQILQGLGARNRWKFSSLGPGSMQLDHKWEAHDNWKSPPPSQQWTVELLQCVQYDYIYIVLYSIIYIVLYLNIIHTKSWVNMKWHQFGSECRFAVVQLERCRLPGSYLRNFRVPICMLCYHYYNHHSYDHHLNIVMIIIIVFIIVSVIIFSTAIIKIYRY